MNLIPVFKPCTGQEEADAVADVLKSGWIGLGPKTNEFEKAVGNYLDAPYVVGVNSCTAALDLATILVGIEPDDEVIVPTITFVSTAHAVCYRRARPVFADVEPDTLNISLEDVARKITPKTKAVIPVHYGGHPVDVRRLREIVGPDIAIIEDCAHAMGASYYGKKIGTEGNIACFSFHAVKNLAMGDGGAIVVHREEDYQRAIKLRWLGIDKSTWSRTDTNRKYSWQYDVSEIGCKCHMNDIAAAIGLVQLRKLDAMNGRRREIVEQYDRALKGVVNLPPKEPPTFKSSWHLYCIKADNRDGLAEYLAQQGISTSVHYYPIHLYDCYGDQARLPVAEAAATRMMTLPLFPDLTDSDVTKITSHIRKFMGYEDVK